MFRDGIVAPALFIFASIISTFVLTGTAIGADSWKFGVIPDTQWGPFTEENQGVGIHIIDAVVDEMIKQDVDLVIHVGDLTDKASEAAFAKAAEHFKPLADAGIKFYPIRGNHDSSNDESAEQFAKAFPNLPGTPGAEGSSPDLPGMAGLTYAFTHKDVKFVMLDIFRVKDGDRIVDYKPGDFQSWIDAELQADDHRHTFVVSHKNLIGQNHKDNLFTSSDNINRYPDMQNAFFKSLQNHGVRYYLSGHDHLYYRARIKSPDREAEVMQIICGSCANKFYSPKAPYSLRDIPLAQETRRNGFMIFTVEDDKVTGEYYSTPPFGQEPARPKWELRERFGYSLDGSTFEEQKIDMNNFYRYNIVP